MDFSAAPQTAAKRFVALEQSAPPAGALEFCAADPSRCGAQAAAYFGKSDKPADEQPGLSAVGGVDGAKPAAGAQEEAFKYMMAARRRSADAASIVEVSDVIIVEARATNAPVVLNDVLWAQLVDVQTKVNAALIPATDMEIYGREEVWALPLERWTQKGPARGDCEDFALEKRARLLALGWPPEALSLTVADAPRIGMHAVLVVSTDRGDFVLDNMQARPILAESLDYVWLSQQRGQDLLAWTQTALSNTQTAPVAPEAVFASLLQAKIAKAEAAREAAFEDAASEPEQAAFKLLPAASETVAGEAPKEPPVQAEPVTDAYIFMVDAAQEMSTLEAFLATGLSPYERFALDTGPEHQFAAGGAADAGREEFVPAKSRPGMPAAPSASKDLIA